MPELETVNLNDSDCLVEEQQISCITLDDSYEPEEGELDEDDGGQENICQIKFSNIAAFEQFGELIPEAIKTKLNKLSDKKVEIVPSESTWTVQIRYVTQDNTATNTHEDENTANTEAPRSDREDSPDLSGISELFTIDTTPAPKLDTVKVPSYKRAIKDALLDGEAAATKRQKQEEKNMKVSKTSNCFNCGEADHNIRECPMPHNPRRIKMAKKNFTKTDRYHVDVEQRFAHLRPGNISDKLREAMGLRKGEIPFFFYRMRVLGYPPGWLEEAKDEHSGITLFNADGSKILHSDEDDGEVDSNNQKYNISKIIDFPGYNQDPGENFFDDYEHHNVPPFNRNQLKEEFVKTLGDNIVQGYKRKKLKDFPKSNPDDSANDSFQVQVSDMEIEDTDMNTTTDIEFVRPPPPSEPPQIDDDIPPPPPPLSPIVSHKEEDLPESPSLAELERKKNQLLKELNVSVIEIDDSLVDDIIELENQEEDLNNENIVDEKNDNTPGFSEISQGDTEESKDSHKSVETNPDVIEKSFMGTPVLKFSPYDCLPNGDNFKVGVSDVINFENLPDSTGKYENMKELIKKVRTVIHKIHTDD
ncbi:zinc finger CCHC domain-containing protein 8 homolog [Haematobia irritans]|uniref:zinc finger CCHC domain-containing protein 8 homolog n=1 Tax=Haematobia irritans TaxID=7368 RepID=UPI003F5061AD